MNLKSVAVVVFQSKDLTGGESESGGREREGETERGRGSARGRAKGKTGDCSFSLLIRAPTPTGFSSTKDPERKWANPAKLEGENRLRRLSRTLPSIPLPSRSIFTFSNSILRSSSLFLPFTSPLPESSLASPVEPPLSLRAAPPNPNATGALVLFPPCFAHTYAAPMRNISYRPETTTSPAPRTEVTPGHLVVRDSALLCRRRLECDVEPRSS